MVETENTQVCDLVGMREFARRLAGQLQTPFTLGLVGELGAGKTTFTKLLVEELGGEIEVTSPTFVLSHEYVLKNMQIEHWDLYRVSAVPEELLEPPTDSLIRVIEWVDRFPEYLRQCDLVYTFSLVDEERRSVKKDIRPVREKTRLKVY